jgi:hypothetical protein
MKLVIMHFSVNRIMHWRPLRWLSLALVGCLSVVSLSFSPVQAQTNDENAFCTANAEPLEDAIQGRSYGDPHINTFDGLHYSFQMAGEFILTQARSTDFEVQARQKPVPGRSGVSLNAAVAMQVCGHRVAIYAQDIPDGGVNSVWIDGLPAPLEASAIPLPGGGELQELGGTGNYAIIWPSGDQVIIRSIRAGGADFLNIMPTLSPAHREEVIGLLGNFNRNPEDDLLGREGTIVPAQSSYSLATNALDRALPAVIPVREVEDAYFDSLYRQFGDSWRVRPSESLFDYAPGQSTVTFTDRSFPREFVTLNGVAPARVEAALDTCREAGVEEALLDGCVFDVAATGDSDFTNAATNAIANVVIQELTDRVLDEVWDAVPIPRFPF